LLRPLILHLSNQPVAVARQSFYVARLIGVITKRSPQLPDGGVDGVVEIYEGVGVPQTLAEFLAGNPLPRLVHKDSENLEGQTLEWDLAVLFAQFPRDQVDRERSEPYLPTCCSQNWHEAFAAFRSTNSKNRTLRFGTKSNLTSDWSARLMN
jgi:hypothetical protein